MNSIEAPQQLQFPKSDQNVFSYEVCPKFVARSSLAIPHKECWYCRHADFHLEKEKPLEVGICCYPAIIIA